MNAAFNADNSSITCQLELIDYDQNYNSNNFKIQCCDYLRKRAKLELQIRDFQGPLGHF